MSDNEKYMTICGVKMRVMKADIPEDKMMLIGAKTPKNTDFGPAWQHDAAIVDMQTGEIRIGKFEEPMRVDIP